MSGNDCDISKDGSQLILFERFWEEFIHSGSEEAFAVARYPVHVRHPNIHEDRTEFIRSEGVERPFSGFGKFRSVAKNIEHFAR